MSRSWFAIVVVLAATFYMTPSGSQPAPPTASAAKTKLEAFHGASGAAIIKGYAKVGSIDAIGKVDVVAMTFRDAQTSVESKGIVIEVKQASTHSRDGSRAFIDYDEIAGLLAGIDYIGRTDNSTTAFPSFEAIYATKGELKVTVFDNPRGKITASVEVGRYGAFLTMEQLTQFWELIARAQRIIDQPELARVKTLGTRQFSVAQPAAKPEKPPTAAPAVPNPKPKPMAQPLGGNLQPSWPSSAFSTIRGN